MSLKDTLYKGTLGTLALAILSVTQPSTKPQELSDLLGQKQVAAQTLNNANNGVHDESFYEELARKSEKRGPQYYEKHYKELIKEFQPYENDPNNKSALFYNNLGVAYALDGNKEKAEKMYKKSIELDPNNEENRVNLAYFYLKTVNTPESRKLAEELYLYVLEHINPDSKYAKFFLEKIRKGKF